jgi:hypothetical protein
MLGPGHTAWAEVIITVRQMFSAGSPKRRGNASVW